jgi:predicted hotdog family 3-hydroxylacyl-ACP dehydratase
MIALVPVSGCHDNQQLPCSMMHLPHSTHDLMLHQPPMLLVDAVLSAKSDASGTAEARISTDNIFVDHNGILAPEALVELMAQAFAAINGYQARLSGQPGPKGYLVGARQVRFFHAAQAGDQLRIHVRPAGDFAGFVLVAGEVRRQDLILAQGELKIWLGKDDALPKAGP